MNQNPQHLVVHRLGPYHPQEIKGIEEVLQDEGIRRFALLEIIRNNGLRLFRDLDGSILSTPRGLSWALSSDSALLGTTGDVQVTTLQGVKIKKHRMGTPLPIVVRIRKSLNSFSNIHQASQNVFVLTALHWGSMYSKEIQLPVTLDFAQRIASAYRDGIEPHDCLRDTPWFL